MKPIIYSDTVIDKLQVLQKQLTEEYGKKKSDIIIKKITSKLDNLSIFNCGEAVKERFGIECEYMFLYIDSNFFFYKDSPDKIVVLDMFYEKEDFIYVLFGIPMRNQDSIDYWGE